MLYSRVWCSAQETGVCNVGGRQSCYSCINFDCLVGRSTSGSCAAWSRSTYISRCKPRDQNFGGVKITAIKQAFSIWKGRGRAAYPCCCCLICPKLLMTSTSSYSVGGSHLSPACWQCEQDMVWVCRLLKRHGHGHLCSSAAVKCFWDVLV